ncbi:MAG: peptidase M17, partial [Xanthomarina sp.]
MIKQGKLYSKDGHIAFIVGKEFKTAEGVPAIVEEQAKKFIASDEKTDYIKLGDQFVFFIKENNDLEKIRVAGHELRTKLNKSAKELFILGKGAPVLALAEGLALSNYQFLK